LFIFLSQNLSCPLNYNPSDYYIGKLAVVPTKKEETKASIEVGHRIVL